MLVGRKKSKGAASTATAPRPASTASAAAPTVLVGRKRGKVPKKTAPCVTVGSRAMQSGATAANTSQNGVGAKTLSTTRHHNNGVGEMKTLPSSSSWRLTSPPLSNEQISVEVGRNISSLPSQETSGMFRTAASQIPLQSEVEKKTIPRATLITKPVTISLSSASSPVSGLTSRPLSHDQTSLKIGRNSSSLPRTATIQIPLKSGVEHKPTNVTSKLTMGNSAGNASSSTEAAPKIKHEPTVVTDTSPSDSQQSRRRRLVRIYSTILRTHLAPSLLLELHLLVRLVSLSEKSRTMKTVAPDALTPFSEVFRREPSCREFGAETLASLSSVLVNMGHDTVKLFATLPALQRRCPRLCHTLRESVRADEAALPFAADQKALGAHAHTPHLTLPFEPARDSRHHHRSAEGHRRFKEREGLRDAFLYQLRAFQDVRGRLLEETHVDAVRGRARELLRTLSPQNTPWFVDFFCDLLLQTGLVPVSETDAEVLKQIGDKKRLQKLHMRFTSKSGHTNKSSRKLDIDQNGPSSSAHTAMPEQSFPGHQEFFSIFLRAGDSYRFNVHMKRRLALLLAEMAAAVNETKGLCDHIAKTQMLATFLGMLEFSPNWHLSSGSTERIEISLPPIDVKECIEAAWRHSRLVIVIPWVVQFLGMMKWDALSRRFQYYIETFSLLRSINLYCLPYQIERHCYYHTNLIMLSLQLDNLFLDVVGLAPAHNLPLLALPPRTPGVASNSSALVSFDELPLWFSKSYLFPSIPHLKDLCELLKAQGQGKMPATSSAKKVRPSTVDASGIDASQNCVSRIPFKGDAPSPWSTKRPGTPANKGGIKDRLIDSFFHQHKDLQQLCEMTVDRAMKNFSKTVSQSVIPSIFKDGATSFEEYFRRSPIMTLGQYMVLLKGPEAAAHEEATTMMNTDFDRIITGTLQLLAPPETKPTVVEIACSLAITHATQKGRNVIRALIREEKKKLVEEFTRKEKKSEAGVPLSSSKRGPAQPRKSTVTYNANTQSIIDFTASLRAFDEPGDCRLEQLKQQKAKVMDQLATCFIGAESSQSMVDFELQIMSMLQKFFSDPAPKCASLLKATIEGAEVLSLLRKLGYAASSNKEEVESLVCNTNNMLELVDPANYTKSTAHPTHSISHEAIGHLLFLLLEGSLVCYRPLEKALLHAAKAGAGGKRVSRVLLDRLASGRAGEGDTTGRLVIMVRLQKMLEGDRRQRGQHRLAIQPRCEH